MTDLSYPDLFGNEIDEFKTAKDRYGVWPTTVWECDAHDSKTLRLKELIGDGGGARRGSGVSAYPDKRRASARFECFTKASDDMSVYRGKTTESIFSPATASWILNCFAPIGGGLCFDPFAGGGTRAIMAAKHGLFYLGVELRQEEVEAVYQRLTFCGVDEKQAHIVRGDSRDCTSIAHDNTADFLLTCPPYWNLEQYNGGENDLSMIKDYGQFIEEMAKVVGETHRILRPGALSCWVVGLHRHKNGNLAPLHHDIVRLHEEAGFSLMEEVILSQKNNGAIQRVGNFDKGNRRLIRTHEYLLVFKARIKQDAGMFAELD